MEEFDEVLVRVIDRTIRYTFGDRNAVVIYNYLEKSGCPITEIPTKPYQFSVELRRILGPGRGQLLGAAPILEETILKALCAEIRIEIDTQSGTSFAENIIELRRVYEGNGGLRHLAHLEGSTP